MPAQKSLEPYWMHHVYAIKNKETKPNLSGQTFDLMNIIISHQEILVNLFSYPFDTTIHTHSGTYIYTHTLHLYPHTPRHICLHPHAYVYTYTLHHIIIYNHTDMFVATSVIIVIVIIVGKGISDPSSIPGWGCLRFILMLLEKASTNLFWPSLRRKSLKNWSCVTSSEWQWKEYISTCICIIDICRPSHQPDECGIRPF